MKFYIYRKASAYTALCLLITSTLYAQQPQQYFQKQFHFITDNDAYVFQLKDGYYTNGLFLQYTWLGNSEKKRKTIHSIQLGQRLYNSNHGDPPSEAEVDRPFCGYLYGQYQQTQFINNYSFFSWAGSIGSIGKASLGEAVQNSYHDIFNFYEPTGWEYQLNNAVEVDGFIKAGTTLFPKISNGISLKPVAQVNLGTTFTGASAGMYFQLGALEDAKNSVLFEGHLNENGVHTKRKFETFVYFFPRIIVQGYNATIQGGMFRNHKGPVTDDPEHLVYQHTIGWIYTQARFNIGLSLIYETKEAQRQLENQTYGSIRVGYCFR